jgi:hypothetical protein
MRKIPGGTRQLSRKQRKTTHHNRRQDEKMTEGKGREGKRREG